jgi:ribosomal protein S18 acetylase RimI-like enzyme
MLKVRRAELRDLESVAAIGVRTYLDHYRDLWSPPQLERFLDASFGRAALERDFADPGVSYLLAHDARTLVGFAKTIDGRPLPNTAQLHGLELQKIYFRREATSRGHGAVLLEHVIGHALARRQPLVWLDVLKSNAAAKRFYEQHGFETIGSDLLRMAERELPMWVMRRVLA